MYLCPYMILVSLCTVMLYSAVHVALRDIEVDSQDVCSRALSLCTVLCMMYCHTAKYRG